MAKFTHLHVHTEYSLLDGLPKIKNLVKRVKELEMEAVAITDHGVMYGAIEFYQACHELGINPIIGMEGYVVQKDHKQKEDKSDKANNHLILLAKNEEGYKNLMKISSISYLEGFYYRPRFDKETLKKHSGGLICLSSCAKGEVGQLLTEGNNKKAKEVALWYQEIFGEGNYYIEIQRHQYSSFVDKATNASVKDNLRTLQKNEDTWVKGAIKLSRELGIPLVATNDVHYLKKEDAFVQDVLVCVSTGKNVGDFDRLRYIDAPTIHLRTEEEMRELFHDVPDAVDNTAKIAGAVDLKIKLKEWLFPKIEVPNKKTAADYLREVAGERFKVKFPKADKKTRERLEYELKVIIDKGYASYFLMMADLVNWCTEKGIVTNTRGSAAGSLVSYVLGITTVDPIRYELPFERFLNPFRPKPPDIDLDVADDRREEVFKYLTAKYEEEKVAQICTFGRMLARAAIRDVGRVLGHPYSFPDRLAKLVPLGSQGFPMTIKKALVISPELKTIYDTDAEAKKLLDLAQEVEGNARHSSVHAAGIVISPEAMTNYTPLQLEPKGTKVITQYEMHACEEVGLVKFDILGIRNLSILQAAIEIIDRSRGVKIDLTTLPLDDKKTFQMLSRGETMGVFQLGGSGMTRWLKELKPNRVEDLMVMVALFRPGPMANIPEFIARKNKKATTAYLHPKMKNFLEASLGILVYQEDVLFTAMELAGYNWETVDKLRNAIGKKIPSEMDKQHEIFVQGCQKHSKLTKEEAENLWDLFVPFQGYGFNKAHAASYGIVSYQTAYVKAHYPVEYMTALLTAEASDTDKVTEAITECKRTGIIVLPPDINTSQARFTVEDRPGSLDSKAIRFGLSAIKNVGIAAIEAILTAREVGGEFGSLTEFCQRVDAQKVNKRVLESLIKVGAMDRFGKRAAMIGALGEIRLKSEAEQRRKNDGQASLFDQDEGEKEKIAISDTFPQIEEFPKAELLNLEKELLGFYLTEHPLASVVAMFSDEVTHKIADLGDLNDPVSKARIGGIISSLRIVLTKNGGSQMAFGTIEDDTGTIDIVVFPKIFASTRSSWTENKIVLIEGKIEEREGARSLLVDSALPFSKEGAGKKEEFDFLIKIPKGVKPQALIEINKLLKKNPGKQKGSLIFEGNGEGKNQKRLVLNYGVDYTLNLRRELKKLLN